MKNMKTLIIAKREGVRLLNGRLFRVNMVFELNTYLKLQFSEFSMLNAKGYLNPF